MRVRSVWIVSMTSLLGACDENPTSIQLSARLSLAISGEAAPQARAVDVHAYYMRAEAQATLRRETFDLVNGSRTIPLELDISPCLSDATREGTRCAVLVDLLLLDVSNTSMDSVHLGPINVAAGGAVERTVTLRAVSSISVALPAVLTIGDTARAIAEPHSSTGGVVTGESVTWSSSNPAVVTVSSNGLVTAVTVGTALVSATSRGIVGQATVTVPPGAAIDPVGDAVAVAGAAPLPDLIAVSVTATSTDLRLSVRFAPGSFDADRTRAHFSFDTDQNPNTGHPGVAADGSMDANVIGLEYAVDFAGAFATLLQHIGPPDDFFVLAGTFPATATANGFDASIPLSALGGNDGRLNFKVTSTVRLTPTTFTGILDVLPNVGLPPVGTRSATAAIDTRARSSPTTSARSPTSPSQAAADSRTSSSSPRPAPRTAP